MYHNLHLSIGIRMNFKDQLEKSTQEIFSVCEKNVQDKVSHLVEKEMEIRTKAIHTQYMTLLRQTMKEFGFEVSEDFYEKLQPENVVPSVELTKEQEYSSLTLVQLKAKCKQYGIKSTMKKDQLITHLLEFERQPLPPTDHLNCNVDMFKTWKKTQLQEECQRRQITSFKKSMNKDQMVELLKQHHEQNNRRMESFDNHEEESVDNDEPVVNHEEESVDNDEPVVNHEEESVDNDESVVNHEEESVVENESSFKRTSDIVPTPVYDEEHQCEEENDSIVSSSSEGTPEKAPTVDCPDSNKIGEYDNLGSFMYGCMNLVDNSPPTISYEDKKYEKMKIPELKRLCSDRDIDIKNVRTHRQFVNVLRKHEKDGSLRYLNETNSIL